MSTSDEKRSLPSRSNRGKRLTELIGEEAEADSKFWNQEFFQDDEGDTGEFTAIQEEEDIVDPDFYLPEEDEADTGPTDKELQKQEKKQKKSVYVDPKKQKKKIPIQRKRKKKAEQPQQPITPRKSAREETKKKSEEVAERLRLQSERKKKKQKRVEYKLPSQEEMLREAEITARLNTESLYNLLQIEEERKQRVRERARQVYTGPAIRYHSKDGENKIIFTQTAVIPQEINCKEGIPPKKNFCVITGKEAKYLDPLTRMPFANLEAFQRIRHLYQHFKMSSNPSAPTILNDFRQYLFVNQQNTKNPQDIQLT